MNGRWERGSRRGCGRQIEGLERQTEVEREMATEETAEMRGEWWEAEKDGETRERKNDKEGRERQSARASRMGKIAGNWQ